MKIRRDSFVLLFYLLTGISYHLEAQWNNFQTYTLEDGLPQSNVYCIEQDSRGYLWLGTDGGGAVRFDGKDFVVYNTHSGLAGDVVRAIREDSNGRIWFGTDGGISISDGIDFTNINADDSLHGSTILCFLEDQDGSMWAGSDDDGINQITFSKDSLYIKHIGVDDGLSSHAVFDMLRDQYGKIWLATLYGGMDVLDFSGDSISIKVLQGGFDIPSDNLLSLEEDINGNIWVGSYDAGAFKIQVDSSDWKIMTYPVINTGSVWDIEISHNNEIWLATMQRGVLRLRSGNEPGDTLQVSQYSTDQGVAGEQILSLFEDQEHNVWIGTNGNGLVKFMGDMFAHFTEKEGLSNNKVQAIDQDKAGDYWMVSDGGGVSRLSFNGETPEFTNMGLQNGLQTNYLTSLSLGCNCSFNPYMWFGSTSEGIIRYDGKSFTQFTEMDGLLENRIKDILVDQNGVVWIGTARSLSKYDGNRFLNVKMSDMMISDEGVKYLLEDTDGIIWMATAGALAKYDGNGSLTTYDQVEGLSMPDVNSICEGPKGNIWIGTNGGGLFVFDKTTGDSVKVHFVANDSLLSSNTINAMVFVDPRKLLLGTNHGMDIVHFNNQMNVVGVQNFSASDGFTGMECNDNAITKDIKGAIWIGTVGGVTRYDPFVEGPSKRAPIVHITDIRMQFEHVNWKSDGYSVIPFFNVPDHPVFNYRQNHLTFYFSGIYLTNPEKVMYSYKLEGLGTRWSPPDYQNKVTFSGLGSGDYTLWVKAVNSGGVWSDPIEYHFVILPPWYRTWWFYAFCMVFILALVVFYIKMRERKLKEEKRVLEEKVVERTAEVVKQRDEIATQKEEIEIKNKEILDSINYAQRIQMAVLPLDEMRQKLLPSSFVLFKPKDIVSGDFYWLSQRSGKVLFTAADCTGHGVPGAFMSMLGTAFLNEAVNEKGIYEPNEILNEVRSNIIHALKQTGKEGQQKDGMDMSLCALDKAEKKVAFSGANNPLWVLRPAGNPLVLDGKSLEEPNLDENGLWLFDIKADKQPVGYLTGEEGSFTNHIIDLMPGDCLYCFSDGFPDQFGGPKGKKFKYKTFKRLLMELNPLPMDEQRQRLDATIMAWMEGYDQIDDICVIGVRIV